MPGQRSKTKKAVTWWVERDLLDRLAEEAARRGTSSVGLAVDAIEAELQRSEAASPPS